MDAKDEVEIEKNKLASLPLQESKRKRDEKYEELRISRSDLRRQIQDNQAYNSRIESLYYIYDNPGKTLFGSTVSEQYDPSMDVNDPLDLAERVLGHGGSQVYYDDSVVTDQQVDELYAELGEIEIARVRREQRKAFFSNLQGN